MPLSKTEQVCYDYMIKGLSNEAIADLMFIGVKSVKFHITHIFHKLAVKSRYELMAKHYRLELERLCEKHQREIERVLAEDFKRARAELLPRGE
jgi:DNA-binding CsgD family transcriptional regulator